MFKNVGQALKFSNKLRDDSKRTKADLEQKANEKWLSKLAATAAHSDDGQQGAKRAAGQVKDGGFLVRQSRKKFSKFVARLQNVRTLSKSHISKGGGGDQTEPRKLEQLVKSKDKVVKFNLEPECDCDSERRRNVYLGEDHFEDSDDDDAYVSASDTFDDADYDEAEPLGHDVEFGAPVAATAAPSASSQLDDELAGDKLVLPEELCDIPTFLNTKNCSSEIIEETRRLLKERYAQSPDSFYESDYKRMLADDWTVTRFLLRRRQDPKRTAKLMEECGRFRRQYKMGEVQLWEFPIEFHLAGGLFKYAPDLVGNVTMYMRIKMYRRVPEISDVFKAFILCVLEQCDVQSDGRGTAVVFDLSGCGLQNVDLGFLYWLLNSFRNYCPKGVSYILVYNLPWFLSATAKLAMTWMSETNRRSLRFVQGNEIENFIARENLPDYLGGSCQFDYKAVPAGSRPAVEVCEQMDITPEQALKIKQLFKEYLPDNYELAAADNKASGAHPDEAHTPGPATSVGLDSSGPVAELVSKASKFMATN